MPAPPGNEEPHRVPPLSIASTSLQHAAGSYDTRSHFDKLQSPGEFELDEFRLSRASQSEERTPILESAPLNRRLQVEDSGFGSDEEEEEEHTGGSSSKTQMKRKTRSKREAKAPPVEEDETDQANGDMIEHRRKHSIATDGSATSQIMNLMNRESFSLDDTPPRTPLAEEPSAHGFWDLPIQDRKNFLLLILLYFLQGIPMGLAHGSVPFLLKQAELSYGQIGVFTLATYPYSLKLLWSPIVDAVWNPKIGRRKSWILPVQVLSGIGMVWLGGRAEAMIKEAGSKGGPSIWGFTWWWFFLVFTCATQDIAVDGWALTLLSHKHIAYASTAQTVGLTAGQFFSHTVFLAFNAPDFANKFFRSVPSEEPVMTLGGYLTFWGWAYIAVTIGLAVLKTEEKTKEKDSISEVYKVMLGIMKLKNIQTIIIIHLIAKIGFQANDAVTNLKLLEKGFSQEDLALTVLIDFPFEIALGYYVGKWSSTYPPMLLWCWAFVGRLVAAAFAQIVVMIFPPGGTTTWYLLTVIFEHVFSTFMNTVMFVAVSAFHAKIADPVIGGTYMTLLATVSNLGGTFPRYFVLELVDTFTVATCIPPTTKGMLSTAKEGVKPITSPFSCAAEEDRHRCLRGGGTCNISVDGYYIMNIVCIVFGVVTFVGYIRAKAITLQSLPLKAWRLVSVE